MSRRTTAERQAIAAVYQARSEAAATYMVSTAQCQYDRSRRVLTLASEAIGMPSTFWVRSHHTRKIVRFVTVDQNDRLFDQDGWDGQQQVYRPVGDVPGVDHMVIYNQY